VRIFAECAIDTLSEVRMLAKDPAEVSRGEFRRSGGPVRRGALPGHPHR